MEDEKMSNRKDGKPRGRCTLEFKLEAARLVKGGQAAAVTAKVLGMPKQTLDTWVRRNEKNG
jgi:transposase-like protein